MTYSKKTSECFDQKYIRMPKNIAVIAVACYVATSLKNSYAHHDLQSISSKDISNAIENAPEHIQQLLIAYDSADLAVLNSLAAQLYVNPNLEWLISYSLNQYMAQISLEQSIKQQNIDYIDNDVNYGADDEMFNDMHLDAVLDEASSWDSITIADDDNQQQSSSSSKTVLILGGIAGTAGIATVALAGSSSSDSIDTINEQISTIQQDTKAALEEAAPSVEEVIEDVPAEEPVEETPAEEATEEAEPAAEAEEATEEMPEVEPTEETPAEETPAEEATEETPAEEATEETPAEEATEETPAEDATEETPVEEEEPAEETFNERQIELLTKIDNVKIEVSGSNPVVYFNILSQIENDQSIESNTNYVYLELFEKEMPNTVENFLKYVDNELYDGTIFHRVINDFMIQVGEIVWDFDNSKVIYPEVGDSIPFEVNTSLKNIEGTLAMARTADPDSATSQFFINVQDNDFLNTEVTEEGVEYGYAVFGKVISGMEIIDMISEVQTEEFSAAYKDFPVNMQIILDAENISENVVELLENFSQEISAIADNDITQLMLLEDEFDSLTTNMNNLDYWDIS